MKSVLRNCSVMIMVLAAAAVPAGCAKQLPGAPAAEERMLVVARVNGSDITLHSLTDMMNRMTAANAENAVSEPREETRKKALDQLIFQELSVQEAARRGLRVKEAEIDGAITALVGHRTEDYEAFLAQQHLTNEEVRSGIERRILLQRLFALEVTEKISVTDDDVRKEYEGQKERFFEPEKVAVVDVALSPKLGEQAAMKRAAEIIERIQADAEKNPWNLARDDSITVRDLDLSKEKDPVLYTAARKLKEGEISAAIKAGDGVHVLKLSEYTPQRQLSFEEVKAPLKGRLTAVAQAKRFAEWEQELKKGAKIEVLDPPVRRERTGP